MVSAPRGSLATHRMDTVTNSLSYRSVKWHWVGLRIGWSRTVANSSTGVRSMPGHRDWISSVLISAHASGHWSGEAGEVPVGGELSEVRRIATRPYTTGSTSKPLTAMIQLPPSV